MSIVKEYGKYSIVCDSCTEEIGGMESFGEALEKIKEEEWRTAKVDGEFLHYCVSCK